MPAIPSLVAAAVIGMAAMVVRGLTGFGAALIMTPLLFLLFDAKTAVVSAAILQVVVGVALVYQVRRQVERALIRLVLPASIAGIAAGSFLLTQFDGGLLKHLLGVVVMLFALRTMAGLRAPGKRRLAWHPRWGYVAAVLSGLLGALFGASGPPMVIFLENQIQDGIALRATIIAYLLVVDCLRLAGYVASSLITPQVLVLSAAMLPTALAGMVLGARLHIGMDERVFRLLIAVLLGATGLLLVVQ